MAITGGTMPAELKPYYDLRLLRVAEPNLVHTLGAMRRPIPGRGGYSIELRRLEALPTITTALTDEINPPAEGAAPTLTTITAQAQPYGNWIGFSRRFALQAIDPVLDEVAVRLGEQMGRSIDAITREVLVQGTNVIYANNKTARGNLVAGDKLTLKDIQNAVRILMRNNAPPLFGQDYLMIIHPDTLMVLNQDPDIVGHLRNAGPRDFGENPLFTAIHARIYQCQVAVSSQAKIFAGAGGGTPPADVYATLVIGADAYAVVELDSKSCEFIYEPPGSAGASDPLHQKGTIAWAADFTAVIVDNSRIVRIEHTVV